MIQRLVGGSDGMNDSEWGRGHRRGGTWREKGDGGWGKKG